MEHFYHLHHLYFSSSSIIYAIVAGEKETRANPWNEYADTLEWTLPSPPPEHTFEILPKQEEWDKSPAH